MTLKLSTGEDIFYKKSGEGKTLLLCVPGGPGFSHIYLDAFHHHVPTEHFTVVTYDPTATGNSNGRAFYQELNGYVEELSEIVENLGFEHFYLLGHSSGNCIIIDYVLNNHQKPMGVVFLNPFINGKEVLANINQLAGKLSIEFHKKRNGILESQDFNSYVALLSEFWIPRHFCRVNPWPEELVSGISSLSGEVVNHYIGADPLNFSGKMLEWDRKGEIEKLDVSCLIIGGKHDYMPKEHIDWMHEKLQNSQVFIFDQASHTPWMEDPEAVFSKIVGFLKSGL